MYSENMIRNLPCYHCIHCVECRNMERGRFKERKCDITKRWGSMYKAYYCNEFVNRRTESSTYEYNGYRVKKDQLEDYRTENQWREAGYVVKEEAVGKEMYASRFSAINGGKTYIYYLPEEVEKIREDS